MGALLLGEVRVESLIPELLQLRRIRGAESQHGAAGLKVGPECRRSVEVEKVRARQDDPRGSGDLILHDAERLSQVPARKRPRLQENELSVDIRSEAIGPLRCSGHIL